MTTYAVTGSTGHLGRLVVQELLARGVPATEVVALARTPEKAATLGVPVRPVDYSDPATLPEALAGVDVLLLVSGNEVGKRLPQHTAVIEAAKAAGVQRVAYTSIANADDSANPLAPEHKATEEALNKLPKVSGSGAGQIYLAPDMARAFDAAEKAAEKAGDSFVTVDVREVDSH